MAAGIGAAILPLLGQLSAGGGIGAGAPNLQALMGAGGGMPQGAEGGMMSGLGGMGIDRKQAGDLGSAILGLQAPQPQQQLPAAQRPAVPPPSGDMQPAGDEADNERTFLRELLLRMQGGGG